MKRRLMKRKMNKGFTLIELLAVILILGIIALIAIPTVTSVVEQSRKGAADSSAAAFIKAVEELTITKDLSGNKLANGDYTVDELLELGIDLKGTMPDSGFVVIGANDVTNCQLIFGDYVINCGENENEVIKYDLASFTPAENSSYLGMVYYNPTEGKKCTKADFEGNLSSHSTKLVDNNGNKFQEGLENGCMIWYIYKDNGNGTVEMILNHNTSSYGIYSNVKTSAENLSKTWKNSIHFMKAQDFIEVTEADKYLGISLDKSFYMNKYSDFHIFYKDLNIDFDNYYSSFRMNDILEIRDKKDNYRFSWMFENLKDMSSNDDTITKVYNFGFGTGYYLDDQIEFDFKTSHGNVGYWTVGASYIYRPVDGYDQSIILNIGLIGASNYAYLRPVITVNKEVFE